MMYKRGKTLITSNKQTITYPHRPLECRTNYHRQSRCWPMQSGLSTFIIIF